jgi:preprotein translocase subunit SecF
MRQLFNLVIHIVLVLLIWMPMVLIGGHVLEIRQYSFIMLWGFIAGTLGGLLASYVVSWLDRRSKKRMLEDDL